MSLFAHEMLLAAPLMALCLGAIVLLLLDAFVKDRWSKPWVTALFATLSLAMLISNLRFLESGRTIFEGALFVDTLSFFGGVFIIGTLLLNILIAAGRPGDESLQQPAEWYAMLLFATAGAYVFATAAEFIAFFLGLELMSLSLYCLCASARTNRLSTESALKYFLLGSFASAFLLFGISIVFGLTGSTSFTEISAEAPQIDLQLLYLALTLCLVGLVFKIGAVPFHFWIPDVYEGAPTPVTSYMASLVKGASAIALLRVLGLVFGELQFFWTQGVWIVALLTIVVGNVVALTQENVKRMLAYSSIAHAGYVLIAFLALRDSEGASAAILYYLVAYSLASIGAFGVLHAIAASRSADASSAHLSAFDGLSKRHPVFAFMMLLFLVSLAGLPPGMAGLLAKIYVFYSAVQAGYVGITVIAVLASTVSLYYYLRVVVHMYFLPAREGEPRVEVSFALPAALFICAIAVVVLGVFPAPLHDAAFVLAQGF